MFPDLRLLISATVATFFLAAIAGLYASLRITQDQIAARADARTAIEETPATRIAMGWPSPEPGRAAALRELAKIATYSPVVSPEPAVATDRSDVDAVQDTTQSATPTAAENHSHASLNESSTRDSTGSTGIAAAPENGAVNKTDHPDIHGNAGNIAAIEHAAPRADIRPVQKKPPQISKKSVRKAQRRRKPAPPPQPPVDQLITGYPLYLTVPVTN